MTKMRPVSETVMDIVYQSVVQLAKENLPATDMVLCDRSGYEYSSVSSALTALRNRGIVDVARVGRGRQVTILTGEHAGLKTAAVFARPPKPRHVPPRPVAKTEAHCEWCGKSITPRHIERTSYCSKSCAMRHYRHGYRSRKEVDAIQNRPPGPRGCASVEEWIANGGVVLRVEPAPWPPGGTPVRERGNMWTGRVR